MATEWLSTLKKKKIVIYIYEKCFYQLLGYFSKESGKGDGSQLNQQL